jgi:hypothetical protein
VANIIIGVGLFAAAVIVGMIASFQFMEMTFEIDQYLPDGEKLNETIWWTFLKRRRAFSLQRKLLPGNRRARKVKVMHATSVCLFVAAIAVLTARPF